MKKTLALAVLTVVLGRAASGQGTVNFCNYFTGTAADPIVYFNGWVPVSGSQYRVALWAGPSPSSLTLLATTGFYPGAPGYFIGSPVAIPGVPGGGTACVCIAVWDTTVNATTTDATYQEAWAYGSTHWPLWLCGNSGIFGVVTGDPTTTPPGVPADLVPGLTSFSLFNQPFPTPEPTAFVLLGLATATVGFLRRSH